MPMASEDDKNGDKPTLMERLTAMLLREPDEFLDFFGDLGRFIERSADRRCGSNFGSMAVGRR